MQTGPGQGSLPLGAGGGEFDPLQWRPAGPVAQAFGKSAAPVAMIVGPTGGGKSTEAFRRYLRVASWQHPSPRDGIRKARVLCICPTYRRAWDQVIPSYFEVFPFTEGFKGSRGDPADHVFDFNLVVRGEVRRLHLEVLFRAVQDLDIEDFFRGFLFTAIDLPEADTNGDLAQILSLGSNRVGRYPEPADRPDVADEPAYAGISGSANAPIIGSAFHQRFYLKRMPDGSPAPETDRLFKQPGGFSPKHENAGPLRKLRAGRDDYYVNMAKNLDAYDVGRLINNRPGFGRHGQPVHPNFDEDVHVSPKTLTPDPLLPVDIGVDCGGNALTPGVTFSQRAYGGQWRKLHEIWLPKGEQMNTEELGREILHILQARFGNLHRDVGATLHLDPAAAQRSALSEYTVAAALQAYTQIEAVLAPSQNPQHRRSASDRLFKRMIGPQEPAILIDPGCLGLIQGYAGGFHYPKRGPIVGLTPVKNEFSHVVEADEYVNLSVDGLEPSEERFIRRNGWEAQPNLTAILPP
jgi:hypothetical protein